MHNTEIQIFPIAETRVNHEAVREWLRFLEVTEPTINGIMECKPGSDAAFLVALAAKRCYKSFEAGLNPNLTRVRQDMTNTLDAVLAHGHGSVLEHAVFSFAIENVSRVFTGEMNRHRAGWAISEGSMRFIRFGDDIPFTMPASLLPRAGDTAAIVAKKEHAQRVFRQAFDLSQHAYAELTQLWDLENEKDFKVKKEQTSCMRRIIPMGVSTGGVWTGNLRALRHVVALRTEPAAEEEIARVFSEIGSYMIGRVPELFGDFSWGEKGGWVPKFPKV